MKIPVLRKDFTVDEYMIYEAKILGASAVLLICSILEQEQLKAYQDLAWESGTFCTGGGPYGRRNPNGTLDRRQE